MKFDMQLIGPAALALLTALVVSFLMTPVVKSFAYKVGAIDVPKDERRMHHKPIPRLGGLAIFAGFMASILLFVDIWLNPQMQSILLRKRQSLTMPIFLLSMLMQKMMRL